MSQPSLDNDKATKANAPWWNEDAAVAICREQIVKYLRTATICLRSDPSRTSQEEELQVQRAADFALLLVNQPKLAQFVGQLDDCLETILGGAERQARAKWTDDTVVKRHTAHEAIREVLTYIQDLKLWAQFTRILDLQREKVTHERT